MAKRNPSTNEPPVRWKYNPTSQHMTLQEGRHQHNKELFSGNQKKQQQQNCGEKTVSCKREWGRCDLQKNVSWSTDPESKMTQFDALQ